MSDDCVFETAVLEVERGTGSAQHPSVRIFDHIEINKKNPPNIS